MPWTSVPPKASAVLAREFGPQIRRLIASYAVTGPGGMAIAEDLRMVLAQMEAARAAVRGRQPEPNGCASSVRRDEVAEKADQAESVAVAGDAQPAGPDLAVREVAAQLRVGVREVQRLIALKRLPATWRGRQWFIQQADVDAYVAARRGAK